MSDENRPTPPTEEIQIPLADLVRIRRAKARDMVAAGVNPYPYRYETCATSRTSSPDSIASPLKARSFASPARVMSNRKMGKVFFADLRDSTERLQIYVRKDDVGEDSFKLFDQVDLGDIVGCEGTLFVTKTGERTLKVSSFELLTKALHPLPDKHAGLTDKETRYRRRYADLIVNPDVRETFRQAHADHPGHARLS